MPRFFFHVVGRGHKEIDREGIELPSVEVAREQAFQAARELLSEAARSPSNAAAQQLFEVTDENGTVVALVSLVDVADEQ